METLKDSNLWHSSLLFYPLKGFYPAGSLVPASREARSRLPLGGACQCCSSPREAQSTEQNALSAAGEVGDVSKDGRDFPYKRINAGCSCSQSNLNDQLLINSCIRSRAAISAFRISSLILPLAYICVLWLFLPTARGVLHGN